MEDFQTWQTINALASCGEFGAWAWALPGERLSVSEGYYTQLGHPEGAWSPSYEAFARLVHSEDIGDADRAVQAVLSGASDRIEAEVRVRDAEGAWRWVQVRARVTARDRYGAPVEILGLHRNVHEAKMQGHALLAARKMEVLGQLTGGMAHDFNNLVTIFAMNVDLLDGSDPEGLIECREALERAVERSRGFTRSLLSYCRTPAEPGVREHDAVEVAQNLAPMLSSALGDRARLELDLGVRGPCLVDASALENALLNLVLNARDAMLDGPGTVIIRVAEEGERLYLSVVDDGVGMTEEVRSRALEPLFTTKQENEGTGLGLAMVDRHVAAWGGELRLQSELGVGTRVDIILPKVSVREEVEASASNDQPVSPGSVLAPRRILLVDDEGLVAQVTARVLRTRGHSVVAATSPRQALALFHAQPDFDLLLTDISMPFTIDGIELACRLRERVPELPVLFMTGSIDDPGLERARSLGHLLAKPASGSALLSAVDRLTQGVTSSVA